MVIVQFTINLIVFVGKHYFILTIFSIFFKLFIYMYFFMLNHFYTVVFLHYVLVLNIIT